MTVSKLSKLIDELLFQGVSNYNKVVCLFCQFAVALSIVLLLEFAAVITMFVLRSEVQFSAYMPTVLGSSQY